MIPIDSNRRRSFRRVGAITLGLASIALVAAACSSGPSASSNTTTTTTASAPPSGSASTGAGSTVNATTVVIKNFAFSPQKLTVSPGAQIKVENKDGVTHTLTSTSMKFDTGDI